MNSAENRFDNMDGDDAVHDVLRGQVGTHDPARLMIGFGHGVSRFVQAVEVERMIKEWGDGGSQLVSRQKRVAGKTEFMHGDRKARRGFHFRRW